MKKVLLATSALVATAGFASAEVGLSGWAEMGIVSGDRYGLNSNVQFHSDLDIDFTLSGETDNGLTFGASIDLDETGGLGAGTGNPTTGGVGVFTNTAVFVSGSFGTLTMGDTDGAFDWAMQEVGIGSSIADDHTTHLGFNFNSGLDGSNVVFGPLYDGQVLRYDNSFGDFSVALSAELFDSGLIAGFNDIYGIGVKYNAALGGVDLGIGLGYQSGGVTGASIDVWGVSVDAKMDSGFRAILNYSDTTLGAGSVEHMGIGIGYTMDALTVSANYGEFDPSAGASVDGMGVAVNYDLGGAAIQFGYGSDVGAVGAESWSLGLAMSF